MSRASFSGVVRAKDATDGYFRKRPGVTLFTCASVVWAERIVATSSSKGVRNASAVRGLPSYSFLSRAMISRILSAFFMVRPPRRRSHLVAELAEVHGGVRRVPEQVDIVRAVRIVAAAAGKGTVLPDRVHHLLLRLLHAALALGLRQAERMAAAEPGNGMGGLCDLDVAVEADD